MLKDGWVSYDPTDPKNWLQVIAIACAGGLLAALMYSLGMYTK